MTADAAICACGKVWLLAGTRFFDAEGLRHTASTCRPVTA